MSNAIKEFIYYVYKTMMTGSDKYYIGRRKCKTNDPMTDGYFGSGNWVKKVKDKSRLFKVVLAVFDNIEDCKAEEQRLLDIHVGLADNMNISASADGGSLSGKYHPARGKTGELNHRFGIAHTEEAKAKISAAVSGENNPMHGKNHTEETKKKISDAQSGEHNGFYGKTHTEESKLKMSDAQSGETHSQAKLTEADVLLIRELYSTGNYTQKELASKFNVDKTSISNIITRKTWKHLTNEQLAA